jgi:hypothetical protein
LDVFFVAIICPAMQTTCVIVWVQSAAAVQRVAVPLHHGLPAAMPLALPACSLALADDLRSVLDANYSDVLAVCLYLNLPPCALPCLLFLAAPADDLRGLMGVNCSDVLAVRLYLSLPPVMPLALPAYFLALQMTCVA